MINDKQIINGIDVSECRYKFQNKDKFDGKKYCTLHNKLCEDLSFVCDENCQVYEDYKQLKRLQQELDIKEKMLDKFMIGSGEILEKLQEENEKLKEKIYIRKLYHCKSR